MQSISAATYHSSAISVLRFHKPMIARNSSSNENANTTNRGILRWTPPVSVSSKDSNEYNFNVVEDKSESSSGDSCTLDTSTSSSRSDSMEVDSSLQFHLPETRIDQHDSKTRKRRKRNVHVRFTPGTAVEPTTRRILKKKRRVDSSSSSRDDPSTWYTKKELKEIQNSCIFAVRTQDFMASMWPASEQTSSTNDPFLDRFSLHNRQRRKLVRWKMNETTRVVKEFERTTGTKVPPELLSELLRLHSKPMEMDAVEWALNMKKAAASASAACSETAPLRKQKPTTNFAFSTGMLTVLSNGVQQLRQPPMLPSPQSRASILRELQLRGL